MKKIMVLTGVFVLSLCVFVSEVMAGTTEGHAQVKITGFVSEDSGSELIYLSLSDDKVVYIPSANKMSIATALSAFLTKKTVTIYSYTSEAEEPKSFWPGPGIPISGQTVQATRVHRIDVIN